MAQWRVILTLERVDAVLPVVVLSANSEASALVAAALGEEPGIHLVAVTPNLADLADVCGRHTPSVLIVCTTIGPDHGHVIAEICARDCQSVRGIVILAIANLKGRPNLGSLAPLLRHIGRRSGAGPPQVAYYF
jgi:hypothetical protein